MHTRNGANVRFEAGMGREYRRQVMIEIDAARAGHEQSQQRVAVFGQRDVEYRQLVPGRGLTRETSATSRFTPVTSSLSRGCAEA